MGLNRHRRHRAGHRRTSSSQEAKWARLGSGSLWTFKSLRDLSDCKSVRNARQASLRVAALSAGAAAQSLSGVKTVFPQVSTKWRQAFGKLVEDDEWASHSGKLSSCQPVECALGFGPKWSDFWSDPYEPSDWAGALERSLWRPSICSAQFSLDAECYSSAATAVPTVSSLNNMTVEGIRSSSTLSPMLTPHVVDACVDNEHAGVGHLGASGACAASEQRRLERLASGADLLPRYISAFGEASGDDSKARGLPALPSHITVFGDNEPVNGVRRNGGDKVTDAGARRQRNGELRCYVRPAAHLGLAAPRMQHTHANADGPGVAPVENVEVGSSDHGAWAGQGGSDNFFTQVMLTTSIPEPAAPAGNPLGLGDSFSPARVPAMGLVGGGVDTTDFAAAHSSSLRGVVKVRKAEVSNEEKIGEGAFGEVSRAELFPYGDVAIKWIKPEHIAKHSEAFHIEAEILANLNHPNVIRMFGVVTGSPAGDNGGASSPSGAAAHMSDPVVGIVTEFMGNGTLGQVLRSPNGRLSTRQCARIALQMALGMAYLHAQSPAIVHFDLKPDNVLVHGEGENMVAKIADFGLSKLKHGKYVSCPMPRGTLPYMAPEVVFGNGEVSEKVDVYSMGVTLWQLHTGEEPFMRLSNQEILMGLESGTLHLPIPPTCDPEWRSLVEMCMDPNPDNRPSFKELATQLRGILNLQERTAKTSCSCADVAVAAAAAVLDSDATGRTLPRLPGMPLSPATPAAPAAVQQQQQQQHVYLQDVLPPPHPLLRLFQQQPPPPLTPTPMQALPYPYGNMPYVLLPQAMVQNALKAKLPPVSHIPPPPLLQPLPLLPPALPYLQHLSPPPTRPSTPPLKLEQPLLIPLQQQCTSPISQQRKPLAPVQEQHPYGNPMVMQAARQNALPTQLQQNELAYKPGPQPLQPLPFLAPQLLQHPSPPPTPPSTPPPQLEHPLLTHLQQQYCNQVPPLQGMHQTPLQAQMPAQLASYKPQLPGLQQNQQLRYLLQLTPALL
ncbi:hypothetical protein Vretimale_14222 [Volvox reticuliferus]|uniref:Protein kinase domain-containing protein n=1 Tax=Volvox reticuliferus TaxID=1737510 RepID=A0A8J4CQL9_9CHLO|nr:hypothetical protein Vretifemale_15216 [Volvox reticuliferus]GIM10591.1 hypothetical protein Vretimale_14222 [Volvox reticuliferus]